MLDQPVASPPTRTRVPEIARWLAFRRQAEDRSCFSDQAYKRQHLLNQKEVSTIPYRLQQNHRWRRCKKRALGASFVFHGFSQQSGRLLCQSLRAFTI